MPLLAGLLSLLATLFGPSTDPECYALGGLDLRRAQALSEVNMSALRDVYANDVAAARDQRILEQYAARGFRIVGAGMSRGACRVTQRDVDRITLAVTERLTPAWVVSESGDARRLPNDRFTRREVVLTGGDGRWQIASVR